MKIWNFINVRKKRKVDARSRLQPKLNLESLEDRTTPATFLRGVGGLSVNLALNEELTMSSTGGGSYTLALNGANTFAGLDDGNITANGLGTMTVTALPVGESISLFDDIGGLGNVITLNPADGATS